LLFEPPDIETADVESVTSTESVPSDPKHVAQAAAAVGAQDLFVFRRITADRFVHVGGLGRGEGWAGNVDLMLGEEDQARAAVTRMAVVRVGGDTPVRVFGPYYQRTAVFVPLSGDVIVVFGASRPDALTAATDEAIVSAAQSAAAAIGQVSSAKRLADELELLHAVRSLASTDAVRIHEVMKHVVASAVEALSCDLGILYVADLDAVELAAHESSEPLEVEAALPAMRTLFETATSLPACIQDSEADPLPAPLSGQGITSHYVLPVGAPPFAVLALLHTTARPRGFTSLCREVGLRLAESAEPLLRSALTLHDLEAQLDRVGRDARVDPLTKLPNRRAWEEAVNSRSSVAGPTGVIVLDLDRLKAANDERGHHFGDEFLQIVAKTVRSALRDADFIARIGGDEFAVLLPGADAALCHAVATRIGDALAQHPGLGGFPLKASIGDAAAPPAESIAHAQRLADERMYRTKQFDERSRSGPPGR
jgi:diguanylate cyclase (GGDEF)-like protein